MTVGQFNKFWTSNFPDTIPIPHYFKRDYIDRWFRIHSLPESKRYAYNKQEWYILLDRQNKIITDILGDNSDIFIVTGDYTFDGYEELHPLEQVNSIGDMSFVSLEAIDLTKINPETGQLYRPMFSKQIWQPKKFDNLLKDIAVDKLRVFFVAIEKKVIAAPYDGGVDFILDNPETKDAFKAKYKDWLSTRQDGF